MSGTVNIARSIFDHAVFADEPKTEREAWIWIIMEASWKPRTRRVGGVVVETQRGQLAASVRFLASAWKWTAPKVQRYLKRLEKAEMIVTRADTGVTVITVCNYDTFQAGAKSSDTAPIQQRYSADTNEKKDERREEGKEDANASIPIATRFPLDDISKAVHDYNDAAQRAGWPTVQKMTDARRRALRSRLKDCGGNDGWKAAMGRAEASDFLSGRTANPWTGFGFDWIAKPANFTKLMEGNYDNRPQSPQHNRQLSRADATSLGFDVVARTRRASSENLF